MSRIYPRKHRNCRTWGIDYTDPQTGKRVRRAIGNKKMAEIALANIQLKIVKGEHLPDVRFPVTIPEFAERYFAHVQTIHKPETISKDKGRLKLFLEYCKIKNINYLMEITPAIIHAFQTAYMPIHKRKTWNNLLGLIKTMLNRAVEWELIDHNPINSHKPLRLDRTYHFFSKPEIDLIIANAQEPMLTGIMILVHTGIRRAELWHLTWNDIDLSAKKLHVKPSGSFSTKSRDMRAVPLSAPLHAFLMQKIGHSGDRLCSDFYNIDSIRKKFKTLLKRLGIRGTLHDLRHTFASHLAMQGVPIPVIKELLGHSDIRTTMIYAHLLPETHIEAIGKLPY